MEAFINDDAMCKNCGDISVNKVYLVRMIQRCTWDRQSESIMEESEWTRVDPNIVEWSREF
jgi:hypothetical protein